jgi:outer membrane protein
MNIPSLQRWLVLAAFCTLATAANAQGEAPAASPPQESAAMPSPSPTAHAMRPLPVERNWRFGVGLGYGSRTNPLVLSEDIPVIVDIDFAWFGKRWFFDNFDLGFSLADNEWFTLNAVARVNSDRVFFGKTNIKYVNFSLAADGKMSPLPATEPPTQPGVTGGATPQIVPQKLKVPERDFAGEFGLEMLLDGEWGQATLRGFHDVSGTHHGYELSADYSYRFTRGRLSISPSVGISYKSDALSDYYWGVNPDETGLTLVEYEADGGIDWDAGFRASYYLTKNMRLALSANYERLHDGVASSPIVTDDYVLGYFAGMAWQF